MHRSMSIVVAAVLVPAISFGCGGSIAASQADAADSGDSSPQDGSVQDNSSFDSSIQDTYVFDSSVQDSFIQDSSTPDAPDDTGAPYDGPWLPEVGTPACDMEGEDGPHGVCVLCNDIQWHCLGAVFAQCPGGIQQGESCQGWSAPPEDQPLQCFAPCEDGGGAGWSCSFSGFWSGRDPASGCW
jgi:hypothetical protein